MHAWVHCFLQRMKVTWVSRNIPNISWETAHFLEKQIQASDCENVLEIGSANWFSTICIAEFLRESSRWSVTSLEMSRHAFEEAMDNFVSYSQILEGKDADLFSPAHRWPKDDSGVCFFETRNIHYYFWNALEVMDQIASWETNISGKHPKTEFVYSGDRSFDLIFIDGQFVDTLEFYLLGQKLLSSKGTIVIDDAIKYAWKMEGFFEYLDTNNISYETIKLDEDDGILLLRS